MAVPYSNTKLRVPKGFQNILEGFAREILRNQPENVFEFGSKYFDQLLRVRDETGHDPAVHGARLEDRFYNNDSFKSPSVDPGSPQQQDAALKIQTNYRKHAAEQEVDKMKAEEAAERIQAGFRGYQDRQKFQEMKSPESKKEEEEVDIDLTDPDVEKAAVKIQAGFKGFKARQEVKEIKEKSDKTPSETGKKDEEEEVDIDLNDPEVAEAALKIQAGFRGFQARQEIKDMREEKIKEKQREEQTETEHDDSERQMAALKIQTNYRGHLARQEVKAMKETGQRESSAESKKDEEEVDIDLNDPEVEGAALKIQAGFKGMKARQEVRAMKENAEPKAEDKEDEKKPEEEEVDIDLNDPETEKAALKIQAGFKGYKTRKDLKDKQDSETKTDEDKTEPETKPEADDGKKDEEKIDIDLNDPKVEEAATKIQAGFKGFQTRKELKEKKESGTGTEPEPAQVEEGAKEEAPQEEEKKEGEKVDIDLDDPELAKAATKIQAGFKGYKTRQDLKMKRES